MAKFEVILDVARSRSNLYEVVPTENSEHTMIANGLSVEECEPIEGEGVCIYMPVNPKEQYGRAYVSNGEKITHVIETLGNKLTIDKIENVVTYTTPDSREVRLVKLTFSTTEPLFNDEGDNTDYSPSKNLYCYGERIAYADDLGNGSIAPYFAINRYVLGAVKTDEYISTLSITRTA